MRTDSDEVLSPQLSLIPFTDTVENMTTPDWNVIPK